MYSRVSPFLHIQVLVPPQRLKQLVHLHTLDIASDRLVAFLLHSIEILFTVLETVNQYVFMPSCNVALLLLSTEIHLINPSNMTIGIASGTLHLVDLRLI